MRGAQIALLIALACSTAALGACSSDDDDETPEACLTQNGDYREALGAAPGEVSFADGTLISECLVPGQSGGDLARTGELMVETATELNADARRDPASPSTVQLGYLIGAIERGAEGIHNDLVLRVNSAARFSPNGLLPAEFERTFGQGYAAGLESG